MGKLYNLFIDTVLFFVSCIRNVELRLADKKEVLYDLMTVYKTFHAAACPAREKTDCAFSDDRALSAGDLPIRYNVGAACHAVRNGILSLEQIERTVVDADIHGVGHVL